MEIIIMIVAAFLIIVIICAYLISNRINHSDSHHLRKHVYIGMREKEMIAKIGYPYKSLEIDKDTKIVSYKDMNVTAKSIMEIVIKTVIVIKISHRDIGGRYGSYD